MKKYLSITSIILGLFVNVILVYGWYSFKPAPIIGLSGMSLMRAEFFEWLTSSSLNLFLSLISTIGFVLSIMALTKYKSYNKKSLSIIGLIFNLVPTFLFLILILVLLMALIVIGFMAI